MHASTSAGAGRCGSGPVRPELPDPRRNRSQRGGRQVKSGDRKPGQAAVGPSKRLQHPFFSLRKPRHYSRTGKTAAATTSIHCRSNHLMARERLSGSQNGQIEISHATNVRSRQRAGFGRRSTNPIDHKAKIASEWDTRIEYFPARTCEPS